MGPLMTLTFESLLIDVATRGYPCKVSDRDLNIKESFSISGEVVCRVVSLGEVEIGSSQIKVDKSDLDLSDLAKSFDLAWLKSKKAPEAQSIRKTVHVVDLFAGCGGLSIGLHEAARALGIHAESKLAVDFDADALDVFGRNFPSDRLVAGRVDELIDGELGSPATESEASLLAEIGSVDILIGGPPCQGNSALNNHTRHSDDRNELYLRMARFAEIFRPSHVVIENVPGVIKDRSHVAQRTWAYLEKLGYSVDSKTIDVSRLGVPQARKRNVTVASLVTEVDLTSWYGASETPVRPLSWAISDLERQFETTNIFDSSPKPSVENQRRMDFLFENGLHNLPDSERPDCHRLKSHSYTSVYGRMFWDKPAQTITTGFGGMGRGRFVHPNSPRTITPHEAARIQFFPDYFKFPTSRRTLLQKVIGNAVPSKLGYVIGLNLFGRSL